MWVKYHLRPISPMAVKTKVTPSHCFGDIFSFKNTQAKTTVTRPNVDAVTVANTANSWVPA